MEQENRIEMHAWVRCFSYNHAPFIEDTMNGFTMQQTSFPFVCTIVDDASTDGEQDVIVKYLEDHFNLNDATIVKRDESDDYRFVFACHNKNKNCYFAVYFLKYNHYSIKKSKHPYLERWKNIKYTALCEGDDFWIDPLKLQKQHDFLEEHPEYSCCYTKYYTYNQTTRKIVAALGEEYRNLYDMLWKDVSIATCSLMYRTYIYKDYQNDIKPSSRNWLMGDKPLFFYLGYRGETKLIPDYMCKYRILETSASHSTDINIQLKRARNTIDIYHYYADRYYPNDKRLKQKIEGGYLYRAYYNYKELGLDYPTDLKEQITNYNGSYYKLYVVKFLFKAPFLEKMLYGFLRILYMLKMKLTR